MQTSGSGGAGGAATRQLRRVNDAIEAGGWWRQFGAVALLRLTPVVPFRCARDPCICPCMRRRCALSGASDMRACESMKKWGGLLVSRHVSCRPRLAAACTARCVWYAACSTRLCGLWTACRWGFALQPKRLNALRVTTAHTYKVMFKNDQHYAHTDEVLQTETVIE